MRRIAYGVSVGRTFPLRSALVAKVEVMHYGKLRRGKLYCLRGLSGKVARVEGKG